MDYTKYDLSNDAITKSGIPLDDNYMRVKIRVAHVGENRNRSIFTKELLEEMIPSLTYVPILGYIRNDDDNEVDFTDHAEKIEIKNNKPKLRYIGHAYGVIPKDNNARFEWIYGEDGVEREYLVVDGLLWNKFSEVEEIFNRDIYKAQSMELSDDYDGYFNDEGVFVFTKAKFEGLCILGEGVNPAMISATITRFSSSLKTEYKEMLESFNTRFSQLTQMEGADNELKDNKLEPKEPKVEPVEPKTEPKEPEEPKVEPKEPVEPKTEPKVEPKEPETKFSKKKEDDEGEGEGGEPKEPTEPKAEPKQGDEGKTNDDEDKKKKPSRKFELSHDDVRLGLYEALDSNEDYGWISQVFDDHFILEQDGKHFKVNYSKSDEKVQLGEREEVFVHFLNANEKGKLEADRTHMAELESELQSLKQFKEKVELTEKEGVLKEFSSQLTPEEYKSLHENLKNFSVSDIEKEIGALLLRSNRFSAKQGEVSSKVFSAKPQKEFEYGSLEKYFV